MTMSILSPQSQCKCSTDQNGVFELLLITTYPWCTQAPRTRPSSVPGSSCCHTTFVWHIVKSFGHILFMLYCYTSNLKHFPSSGLIFSITKKDQYKIGCLCQRSLAELEIKYSSPGMPDFRNFPLKCLLSH